MTGIDSPSNAPGEPTAPALLSRGRPHAAWSRLASRRVFLAASIAFVLLFYMAFQVFPILLTFVGSFFHWSPLQNRFDAAGLANYRSMLADPLFAKALWLNLYFTFGVVALRTVIGLAIA
ncbi:sugar ABC transporter permease, partial [Ponticoccus sp. SC6-36]|nr:sugar ABC transporter permease [Ponticoccus sp. SC6-36]